MFGFRCLVVVNLLGLKRDKVLWSLFVAAILLLVLVPLVSLLSMRQVQELAVSLSLSWIGLFMLVVTVFLGATSVWRDVEKRYALAVLTLPISRGTYLLAKFVALALFLSLSLIVLGTLSALGIYLASLSYPPERPILWLNYAAALGMLGLKYSLLLAATLLFSTLSTSFFLPVFAALALYFAGNASYEVLQFVVQNSDKYSNYFVYLVKSLHYLLPNLSAFDFQTHAIYSLSLPWDEMMISIFYAIAYGGLVLVAATVLMSRRDL